LVGQGWEGVVVRAKYYGPKGPKQPEEISSLLASVIEKAAVGVDVRHSQLVGEWETVAPTDWASLGTPIGVKNGTLLVEVTDGSAASLLKYQIEDLRAVIAERFGPDLVTAVRIKVATRPRPDRPSK
jgi:predicted nucleic acid-binding Zn ribbon protein